MSMRLSVFSTMIIPLKSISIFKQCHRSYQLSIYRLCCCKQKNWRQQRICSVGVVGKQTNGIVVNKSIDNPIKYLIKMPDDSEEILKTRKFLKERLQTDYSTFRGHENERDNIRQLLQRTAEMGESNSMLLIGPRGSGKTTVSDLFLQIYQSSEIILKLFILAR